jgi:hypothetical protein
MSVATSAESLVQEPLQRQAACLVPTGGPLPRPIQLSVVELVLVQPNYARWLAHLLVWRVYSRARPRRDEL